MTISILIGFVIAFCGLIVGYSLDGGSVRSLVLMSPFLIVFSGTWGAVNVSNGIKDVLSSFKAVFKNISKKNRPDPTFLIEKLCKMSDECRQSGLLKLETMLSDPDLAKPQYLLLKEGIILGLDLNAADQMQEALEADVKAYTSKRQLEIDIFEGAAGYSPTMGVIGTVMGLVQVLSNITDAQKLAESIATAFIATLYGVVFANLIYMPLANQLKVALKREKMFKQMIIDGICMVTRGETSRNIANKLALYYQAFENGEKKYQSGIEN